MNQAAIDSIDLLCEEDAALTEKNARGAAIGVKNMCHEEHRYSASYVMVAPTNKPHFCRLRDSHSGTEEDDFLKKRMLFMTHFSFKLFSQNISPCYHSLFAASASAFAPASQPRSNAFLTRAVLPGAQVDSVGNNVKVKNLLQNVESSGLLSKVAQSGLLSAAQEAGISLSSLEPFLALAAKNPDLLILAEAAGPDLLPLLPKIVDLAPAALPLLTKAVGIPPALLQVAALGSIGAAYVTLQIVPDDTVKDVAIQTLAFATLGVAVPAASLAGASILGKLTK
eukprot:scaffold155144_cov49-Attheya_sp.AAC.2